MTRFVVVEASPVPASPARAGVPAVPAVLRARCADASFGVRLGIADHAHGGASVIDEHFAVDVDACRESRLLDCADVLQGSRARSVADTLRRLTDLTSTHPSCGIVALPLAGVGGTGGWAVTGGPDRAAVLVPRRPYRTYPTHPASREVSLLPSCLHAWLVAGRSLREWPYARVVPSG
ncbi:hypothetical protein ACIBLA_05990 [Streptomyces sp. NPDC050433]|uniref:hypothetical protein n=1 Tax=Streptomyces sp. NPDC050433 TaxID=3365615 RepID=UPI0037A7B51A